MADQEQLAILKQGVEVWNKWREENTFVTINLRNAYLDRADLSQTDLSGAYLSGANLSHANLDGANLSHANLDGANLTRSNLIRANLCDTDLSGAYLSGANLSEANLSKAKLSGANLSGANLSRADLDRAVLNAVNLSRAGLKKANLSRTSTGNTIFVDIDLSETIGLKKISHQYSSIVNTNTLQLSKGKIPAAFLRGCGLSDLDIEYAKLYTPDLSNQKITDITYRIYDLRAHQSIQVSPLFISYSHADAAFVDRLEVALNDKGIRFWRDIHHATSGRLERQIEQAIRHNPTVLLVLSANAVESDWVQHEVRKARGLEKELKRDVLCPVALDDRWKDCGWPERVMEQVMEYNVLDFSKWQDDAVFRQMFDRLLDGLQLFYKG